MGQWCNFPDSAICAIYFCAISHKFKTWRSYLASSNVTEQDFLHSSHDIFFTDTENLAFQLYPQCNDVGIRDEVGIRDDVSIQDHECMLSVHQRLRVRLTVPCVLIAEFIQL